MTDLLWPGDHRAGDLMSDTTLVQFMVQVEAAWLAALVELKIAEPSAADDLAGLVTDDDVPGLAVDAEAGGNPVIPLVVLLRDRVGRGSPDAARWVHRGLTSQDVLDTALQLSLRDVATRLADELRAQVVALAALADQHRGSVMAGRTLTQHAVPVTFGLKASTWLDGLLDAGEDLERAVGGLAAQFGGAAGTLAAVTRLAESAGVEALEVAAHASAALGLNHRRPWHTARATVTRIGDAYVGYTDAMGRIANDVLVLSRPEVGEVAEPAADGRGGSSAMPQKANPILSVLIRRAALAAPLAGAQLHVAAAEAVDERPDGAWHTEWATLRSLSRRTVVAASQATELLTGLQVDKHRMRANADAASNDLLAEARTLDEQEPPLSPTDYLGATDVLIDATLARANRWLGENS